MALADLKVVRVVRGCDLDGSGTEFHIDILVGDDRDLLVDKRKDDHLPDQILVALIVRMDGDRRIAEHRLGTRCRDLERVVSPDDRIADMPEMSFLILVLDLGVREGRLADRAPVDDPLAAVDISLLIEVQEDRLNRLRASLVHCKALALPVAARSELPKLLRDRSAVLLLPVPDLLQELLAADLALVDTLILQRVRHAHLGRDRGVVGPGNPQRLVSLHPSPADQDILQGLVEGVAHVQLPCNIGRRNHDRERLLVRLHVSVERSGLLPFLIPFLFNTARIICACKLQFSLPPAFYYRHFSPGSDLPTHRQHPPQNLRADSSSAAAGARRKTRLSQFIIIPLSGLNNNCLEM